MASLNKNIDTSKYGGAVLLLILVVGGFAYWSYSNSISNEDTYTPTTPQLTTSKLQNTTIDSDLKIGDTNEKVDEQGYKHIYVNVVNNGTSKEAVSLMATLYDDANKVVGTQLGAVQNIGAGETKVADIVITDSTMNEYASFKVTIEGSY